MHPAAGLPSGSRPLVTVVIPTYNRAPLLRRALGSVLAQTHRDLEVLVVDDGSTDDTAEVIGACPDPRVRLIHLDARSGAAVARNAGIRAARGTWVAFLDSDDEWLPTKLGAQLTRVGSEDDVGVVYCLAFDPRMDRVWPRRSALHEGDVFEAMLKGGWTPIPSQVIVRRSALMAVGGFDEALPSFQDYDLWLRLAQAGVRFAAVDDVLVVRPRHDGPRITSDPVARARGLRAINRKWGGTIRERLGREAFQTWCEHRMRLLLDTYLPQARAAAARGDRAPARRLCRAMWHGPWHIRIRVGGRALALALLGERGYGLLVRLRAAVSGRCETSEPSPGARARGQTQDLPRP